MARYPDEILEIGDLTIHDKEAFPEEIFPGDVLVMSGAYRTAGLDDDTAAPREVPPRHRSPVPCALTTNVRGLTSAWTWPSTS